MHALFKKKKSNLTYNSHIAFLVQLVCSCGAAVIFNILLVYKARCCSRLPYHNHLARCLDSNWWIVPQREGRVWYICSQATLFYQLHLQVTVQRRRWCFFPPSVCAGREYAPVHTVPRYSLAGRVNHLPVTGGGNTTAGLAVQRWRLARCWVRCLACLLSLEMWIFFSHAGEAKQTGKFLFLSAQKMWTGDTKDFKISFQNYTSDCKYM